MGPTVCEEDGPIPIRKMSSIESMAHAMVKPVGKVNADPGRVPAVPEHTPNPATQGPHCD